MSFDQVKSNLGLPTETTMTDFAINMTLLSLASVGLVVIVFFTVQTVVSLYRVFVRKPYNLKKRYGDGWAVVTGATDGIGKAAAYQLAKRGVNVLLISRTQSKLDDTKKEISAKFPAVSIETLQIDFSSFDKAAQDKVTAAIGKLQGGLSILINNIGVSYDFPVYFHELSDTLVQDMIKLNIDSTTFMTRIALKIMLERPKVSGKRKGAIINIGSAAGSTSNPLLTQYSAAKAYVQRFSEGLASEYGPQGIDVQVHVPFFIVSKLSKFKRASFFVPSSESYGRMICDRIGYEVIVNPHLPHTLLAFLLQHVPTGPRESYTRSMHLGIRSKGMKKQNAKAATVEQGASDEVSKKDS